MITGVVTSQREAIVHLAVHDRDGREHEVEAIIDTGFDGSLTLPPSVIAALGLTRRPCVADGSLNDVRRPKREDDDSMARAGSDLNTPQARHRFVERVGMPLRRVGFCAMKGRRKNGRVPGAGRRKGDACTKGRGRSGFGRCDAAHGCGDGLRCEGRP